MAGTDASVESRDQDLCTHEMCIRVVVKLRSGIVTFKLRSPYRVLCAAQKLRVGSGVLLRRLWRPDRLLRAALCQTEQAAIKCRVQHHAIGNMCGSGFGRNTSESAAGLCGSSFEHIQLAQGFSICTDIMSPGDERYQCFCSKQPTVAGWSALDPRWLPPLRNTRVGLKPVHIWVSRGTSGTILDTGDRDASDHMCSQLMRFAITVTREQDPTLLQRRPHDRDYLQSLTRLRRRQWDAG